MKQYHKPQTKKAGRGTGAKKVESMDKKLAHIGGFFSSTKVGEKDVRETRRTRGGGKIPKLKKAATVNIATKDGIKKAKIIRVLESHNQEYVRMNIITKGAIIETEFGKVRVTNRVGQDGIVNGILLT